MEVNLFFFHAEDGIRDLYVTGVQTCALPISRPPVAICTTTRRAASSSTRTVELLLASVFPTPRCTWSRTRAPTRARKIGRASCRERVSIYEKLLPERNKWLRSECECLFTHQV